MNLADPAKIIYDTRIKRSAHMSVLIWVGLYVWLLIPISLYKAGKELSIYGRNEDMSEKAR